MQIEQALNSGNFHILNPGKALNKSFSKVTPNQTQIGAFKENLIKLLHRIKDADSEEFHKNLFKDFLKKTWYEPNHFIITVKPKKERLGYWFCCCIEVEIAIVERRMNRLELWRVLRAYKKIIIPVILLKEQGNN